MGVHIGHTVVEITARNPLTVLHVLAIDNDDGWDDLNIVLSDDLGWNIGRAICYQGDVHKVRLSNENFSGLAT